MMGSAPVDMRARVFGRYSAVAYLAGAFGALAAGGPAAFRRLYPALPADQRWLLAFPVVAVICALLARRISPAMEADRRTETRLIRSRKNVQQLALLFALDSYGGASSSRRSSSTGST